MLISSESIKIGHPDTVADYIAANIIADIIEEEQKCGMTIDNMPHCGVECFLGKGFCVVGGEVTTKVWVDVEKIVRRTVLEIGYNDYAVGLDGTSMGVLNAIIPQSPDINIGTRADLGKHKEIGAGDQGIMYGYACDETRSLLPLPFVLVNQMMRAFEDSRIPYFAPDGKGQVSVEYDDKGVPIRVAKVLMSNAVDYRCAPRGGQRVIEKEAKRIALGSLGKWADKKTQFLFNPTGEWRAIYSCSTADSGVTGRKLVVQFYGGYPGAQVGGGSVVNKSPEKVDCCAAFGARYAAKNIVAARLAKKCSIQLSYAIGIAKPMSVYVDSFGTGVVPDERLAGLVEEVFELTPRAMIERFDLLNPDIYRRIPRTLFMDNYPWEETDMINELKKRVAKE
jgi:S-adenosylmethionine synthetase